MYYDDLRQPKGLMEGLIWQLFKRLGVYVEYLLFPPTWEEYRTPEPELVHAERKVEERLSLQKWLQGIQGQREQLARIYNNQVVQTLAERPDIGYLYLPDPIRKVKKTLTNGRVQNEFWFFDQADTDGQPYLAYQPAGLMELSTCIISVKMLQFLHRLFHRIMDRPVAAQRQIVPITNDSRFRDKETKPYSAHIQRTPEMRRDSGVQRMKPDRVRRTHEARVKPKMWRVDAIQYHMQRELQEELERVNRAPSHRLSSQYAYRA